MESAWACTLVLQASCTKYLVGGFDKAFEDILSSIQYLLSPRLRGLRVVDGHTRPVSRGGNPVNTGVVNLSV